MNMGVKAWTAYVTSLFTAFKHFLMAYMINAVTFKSWRSRCIGAPKKMKNSYECTIVITMIEKYDSYDLWVYYI